MLLPVSFYGGYFGAGVGILILGVFSIATGGDYRSANVAKNFVSGLNGLVALHRVHNARRGGVAADPRADGRHHRRRAGRLVPCARDPAHRRRVLVVAVGAALTVSFARQYWF